jgi:hypothetical protein
MFMNNSSNLPSPNFRGWSDRNGDLLGKADADEAARRRAPAEPPRRRR